MKLSRNFFPFLIFVFVVLKNGYCIRSSLLDFGIFKPDNGITTLTESLGLGLLSAPQKKSKNQEQGISRSGNRFGKGEENEMTGFLGVGSLANPIIILKKPPDGSPTPEVECARTHFMYPFREMSYIVANGSIMTHRNPVCRWNLIGTEACIPMVSCPIFALDNKNRTCEEYLEIYDGNRGYAKFCGDDAPINISAADGIRDLYLKFQTTKWEGSEKLDFGNILKFNCSISCSGQGDGKPLPATKQPKVNPLCTCGKKWNQDRIINGTAAAKGEFPWLASLVEANTRQPFCGGALINDRFILTAAHCIKGIFMNIKNLEVVINGQVMDTLANSFVNVEKPVSKIYDNVTLAKLDAGNNSMRFYVEEIILHPLYVTETNDFDVALLKLPKTFAFVEAHNLIPTCLPKLGSYLRTYSKYKAIIAGWGLTEKEGKETSPILKKLVVPVIPPTKCKILYAHRINRRMLCAGYEEGIGDSCMGDSGGPLMTEIRRQVWYQIGIVSWGEGCATKANPGVYIRTTEIGQWANYHSNTNDAVWCAVPS